MNITPDTKIAFIYKPLADTKGVSGYLEDGFKQICQTEHFIPGEELPGFDHYMYIDDGPTAYLEPCYHPATFYAFDMVVKPYWYLQPIETYYRRFLNFDYGLVSSTTTLEWCRERGYPAKLIQFAADPRWHRPLDFPKDRDFVAVWHNCEGRIGASRRALERFPGGQVLWVGNDLYAAYIGRGKCALNWLRGDIVNMRVYEVMACRTTLITTRHPDMERFEFQEGIHYLGYDEENIDEMLDQIQWVQDHPVEAEQIAIKAWNLVIEKHTYYHRAKEILDWLP